MGIPYRRWWVTDEARPGPVPHDQPSNLLPDKLQRRLQDIYTYILFIFIVADMAQENTRIKLKVGVKESRKY